MVEAVGLAVGDRVRYSGAFCEVTSTTEAGQRDCASRRGVVIAVHSEGALCNIDWGDCILQSETMSSFLEIAD